MILQGVRNLYEIDTSMAVIGRATELTGVRYGADEGSDVSLRVVADHMRTSVMLIGDGVTPGNEGRGYVLRRIMRRAIRNMRLLGATEPVVAELVDAVIETMGQQYPELRTDRKRIETVALAEEAAFLKTLKGGTNILDTAVTETKASGGQVLSGDKVFLLHDTWGFPIDLTLEMAAEQGLSVDEDGFRRLMKEQRERAKADAKAKKSGHADLSAYRVVADNSRLHRVHRLHLHRGRVDRRRPARRRRALARRHRGRRGRDRPRPHPLLRRGRRPARRPRAGSASTPAPSSRSATSSSRSPVSPCTRASVQVGEVTVGSSAYASIDLTRRRAIARAHSATHLTHQALRDALGPTAAQAGSENSPGPLPLRLRLARRRTRHGPHRRRAEDQRGAGP